MTTALITGATGFLGREILRSRLPRGGETHIIALIRAGDDLTLESATNTRIKRCVRPPWPTLYDALCSSSVDRSASGSGDSAPEGAAVFPRRGPEALVSPQAGGAGRLPFFAARAAGQPRVGSSRVLISKSASIGLIVSGRRSAVLNACSGTCEKA